MQTIMNNNFNSFLKEKMNNKHMILRRIHLKSLPILLTLLMAFYCFLVVLQSFNQKTSHRLNDLKNPNEKKHSRLKEIYLISEKNFDLEQMRAIFIGGYARSGTTLMR